MPELARITVDVGAGAVLEELIAVVEGLSLATLCAAELSASSASLEAEQYIANAFLQGGPQALVDLARSREIRGTENISVEELEILARDVEMFFHEFPFRRSKRYGQSFVWAALAGIPSLYGGGRALGTDPQWQRLLRQLTAAETASRLPDPDMPVQSLIYGNPVTVEIIIDDRTVIALTALIYVIATLPSRLRERRSRERIIRAVARDVEDQVVSRIKTRRVILERISRGDLDVRLEDVDDDFVDRVIDAARKIGTSEISLERFPLPRRAKS
ncbi:hypothetical protein BH10ACT2_BH10ACT2_19680 [soil metagenome]